MHEQRRTPTPQTHDVIRGMPSEGRSRESILAELADFAHDEDKTWETGKCSGTMYCGDHDALRVHGPRRSSCSRT